MITTKNRGIKPLLFEYLKDHYKDGEPIFLDDIHNVLSTEDIILLKTVPL